MRLIVASPNNQGATYATKKTAFIRYPTILYGNGHGFGGLWLPSRPNGLRRPRSGYGQCGQCYRGDGIRHRKRYPHGGAIHLHGLSWHAGHSG